MRYVTNAALTAARWEDNQHWPDLASFKQWYAAERAGLEAFSVHAGPSSDEDFAAYQDAFENRWLAVLTGFGFRLPVGAADFADLGDGGLWTFDDIAAYSEASALPILTFIGDFAEAAFLGELTTPDDGGIWFTRGEIWGMTEAEFNALGNDGFFDDELNLLVAAQAAERKQKHGRRLSAAAAAVAGSQERTNSRRAIPRDVQIFVWQRDGGRCVECGSNQNLEFDHIIPRALGGSDTGRNIQLLCGPCNRRKGATIG